MRWGKTVLIFQAVITLLIGLAFFMQVLELDREKIAELNIEMQEGPLVGGEKSETSGNVMVDIKQRYTLAAYVLLIVSLIELLIIARLFT